MSKLRPLVKSALALASVLFALLLVELGGPPAEAPSPAPGWRRARGA